MNKRVLLVRLDRIGDLILSLPVDESLAKLGYESNWWISKGLDFVTRNAMPPRSSLQIDKPFSVQQFKKLYNLLKSKSFSMVIVFHAPWWIALLLFIARIPIRIGPKSQWYSFLFYNHGVRQKRSEALKSELEYNFSLIEQALNLEDKSIGRQILILKSQMKFDLKTWGLEAKKYFVVHPGMSGSALNWPTKSYIDFIDQELSTSKIVVTGTKSDESFLSDLRSQFSTHPRVLFLDSKLNGDELIFILQNSTGVLAPSTGVLHLAASTGTPSFGIYSPVRVQKPERWGPQGAKTKVFVPGVICPGEFKCLGESCAKFNCMEQIKITKKDMLFQN